MAPAEIMVDSVTWTLTLTLTLSPNLTPQAATYTAGTQAGYAAYWMAASTNNRTATTKLMTRSNSANIRHYSGFIISGKWIISRRRIKAWTVSTSASGYQNWGSRLEVIQKTFEHKGRELPLISTVTGYLSSQRNK